MLKDRYAVLCPTRLLLFKEKPAPLTQALAVYPIVQAEFDLDAEETGAALVMQFAEQVNRQESKPFGPNQNRKFYFQDKTQAKQWLTTFK